MEIMSVFSFKLPQIENTFAKNMLQIYETHLS